MSPISEPWSPAWRTPCSREARKALRRARDPPTLAPAAPGSPRAPRARPRQLRRLAGTGAAELRRGAGTGAASARSRAASAAPIRVRAARCRPNRETVTCATRRQRGSPTSTTRSRSCSRTCDSSSSAASSAATTTARHPHAADRAVRRRRAEGGVTVARTDETVAQILTRKPFAVLGYSPMTPSGVRPTSELPPGSRRPAGHLGAAGHPALRARRRAPRGDLRELRAVAVRPPRRETPGTRTKAGHRADPCAREAYCARVRPRATRRSGRRSRALA